MILKIPLTTYGITYPSAVIIFAFLTLRFTGPDAKLNISFSYPGISVSIACFQSSADSIVLIVSNNLAASRIAVFPPSPPVGGTTINSCKREGGTSVDRVTEESNVERFMR